MASIVGGRTGIVGLGGSPLLEIPQFMKPAGPSYDPRWEATKKLIPPFTREETFRRAAEEAAGQPAPVVDPELANNPDLPSFLEWLRKRNEEGLRQETGMRLNPVPDEMLPYGGPDFRPMPTDSVPPAPAEEPAPAAAAEVDPLAPSPPPGFGTIATGALTLDDYMKQMSQYYPDLDFSNPKQAIADANAKRDLDRTALLAQLQVAGGMLAGAGKSWEGLGKGFLGAAESYDKGFQKYQNALQDSADRYAKESQAKQSYDLARRGAALDLYSKSIGTNKDRTFDIWKFTEEGKRDELKRRDENQRAEKTLAHGDINKAFDKEMDLLPRAAAGEIIMPEVQAEIDRKAIEIQRRREASLRHGYYIPPGSYVPAAVVADKK
ncbi:MAG TPA: hypothetical protein VFZ07_10245 [Dongiaceae bacterium]